MIPHFNDAVSSVFNIHPNWSRSDWGGGKKNMVGADCMKLYAVTEPCTIALFMKKKINFGGNT